MTCAALLRFANQQTAFPIHIDQVIGWIKGNGFQDEIDLIKVDIDRLKVMGIFRQYTRRSVPYADPILVTQVIYPQDLESDFERLVVCKELLHIFDQPKHRVTSAADLDALINGLVLQRLGNSSPETLLNDLQGPFLALAVLIPPRARKQFKEAREKGNITSAEISKFVDLPLPYVDVWTSSTCDSLETMLLEKYNCSDLIL